MLLTYLICNIEKNFQKINQEIWFNWHEFKQKRIWLTDSVVARQKNPLNQQRRNGEVSTYTILASFNLQGEESASIMKLYE